MTQAAYIAPYLTAAGFVALGLATAYQWYRLRGRAQGMLAWALICLAIVAAAGRLQDSSHQSQVLSVVTILAFVASGYFVLLFRNEFVPLGTLPLLAASLLLVVSLAVGIADATLLVHSGPTVVAIAAYELILAWAIFVGEPIVRFWLASNALPAVQKARMRFLSFGFAVLVALIIASVVGGSALQSPTAIVLTQLLALAVVPIIYASFAPPAILRRLWRLGEENALRGSMQDLLIFSPSRQVLAERAVAWAVRLVGARAAFIIDSDGTVMATTGIDADRASKLISNPGDAVPDQQIIVTPLHLTDGQGSLAVLAGPFTPVFGSDEIAQLTAYATSVTAGLERARVTERMAAIEKNKSQFLNLASHELRGPVTIMRGYVSMLEAGLLGHLNERGRKAADVMTDKVGEMNELIEQMIEAARLEDGGLSLRPEEADLRDVARAAADSVKPLVDSKHRVVLDLPERRVRVRVDTERTQTIVTNLLTNAIKYSPGGGAITCRVRAASGIARVSVTDEGVGIAHEHLAVLFTRFGRIVTPETEHLKGTGLGLYLGRQLARLHGGDITVESTPRKGSTFTLHLPAAAAAEPGANRAETTAVG